ncbi:cysteine hydrolase family protein [Undibacterium sp. TC4M20W]|uniref:cysteine hydrolase family protein n=1 Tax=Undibacterium sp. TC4M20W TaxID=3413052 RepID=UPI003BF312C7
MNTLLIIDMQNAWLHGQTRRFDKVNVIKRIQRAVEHTREHGGQVIFVRHANDEALAGSAGWEVIPELPFAPGDVFVDKTACDSFAGTGLDTHLKVTGAQTLIVCGLTTEFCVDTTIRAAASHGFDVIALSDAHTTGDRPHMKAEKIVEHHNWVWSNIATPANSRIMVRTTAEVFGQHY